jgi:hypothetical protein
MKFSTANLVELPSTPTLGCFLSDWPELCYSYTWVDGQAVHLATLPDAPSVYFTRFYVQDNELDLLMQPHPTLTEPPPAPTVSYAEYVPTTSYVPPPLTFSQSYEQPGGLLYVPVPAVPEPGAWALILFGLAIAIAKKRRAL